MGFNWLVIYPVSFPFCLLPGFGVPPLFICLCTHENSHVIAYKGEMLNLQYLLPKKIGEIKA